MKKTKTYLMLIVLLATSTVYAQNTNDEEAIKTTIEHYFEGARTDNPDLLKKAFHPEATLKYAKDGEYSVIPIQKYFTYFTNTKTREFESKIHYVDVSGTAANVKLTTKYATHQFSDYMNMIKLKEGWKIVSKISFRETF